MNNNFFVGISFTFANRQCALLFFCIVVRFFFKLFYSLLSLSLSLTYPRFTHFRAFLFSIPLNRFMLFICFQCFLHLVVVYYPHFRLNGISPSLHYSRLPLFRRSGICSLLYAENLICWTCEPQVASPVFHHQNNANQFQFLSSSGFPEPCFLQINANMPLGHQIHRRYAI